MRDEKKLLKAFKQAVRQSETLTARQKGLAMAVVYTPVVRGALLDYLEELPGEGVAEPADWLVFIFEHLPEIIAFIEAIISLFS